MYELKYLTSTPMQVFRHFLLRLHRKGAWLLPCLPLNQSLCKLQGIVAKRSISYHNVLNILHIYVVMEAPIFTSSYIKLVEIKGKMCFFKTSTDRKKTFNRSISCSKTKSLPINRFMISEHFKAKFTKSDGVITMWVAIP